MITSPSKSISLLSNSLKWDQIILTGIKVFLVTSSILLSTSIYQSALAAGLMGQEAEIINLTNQLRQVRGIPVLEMNTSLTASAQAKAQDMADEGYFGHADNTGNHMTYWIKSTGYNYLRAGENLAKGFNNSKDLMQAWTNSPTHYANLTNSNYRDIGIGIAEGYINGRLTIFVAQHFGEPMPITNIFSAEFGQFFNSTSRVLGDQTLITKSTLITENMAEISLSGSMAVNKSPAGLLWVAYQGVENIAKKTIIPVAAVENINFGLPETGYRSMQTLSTVLVFLGFLGWFSMLIRPIVLMWLGRIRKS